MHEPHVVQCSEPTYEGLKLEAAARLAFGTRGSEPTYEGLKQPRVVGR